MEKVPQNTPANDEKGGCFPTIFLFIGYGLVLVGILSIFNTAFDWDLELSVYGSRTEVPDTWDSAMAVLIIGVIWTLIGFGISSSRFQRFYRKNKILTIVGSIGILVGIFFALDAYDRYLRREAEMAVANMVLDEEAIPETEEEINLYADREVEIITGNPSLDTLQLYLDGEPWLKIQPYEFEDEALKPGSYQLLGLAGRDTLLNQELLIPEGKAADRDLIYILNPDSAFSFALLDFQDFYDPETNNKRIGAKTLNYKLTSLHWRESFIEVNHDGANITLPRRPSIDFSYGTAIKLVVMPEKYRDDYDRSFDYAIWKFIDEEKKGFMQDDFDFMMLPAKEKLKAIKNRLQEDVKRFEASLPPS